jgi:hypothetical protein
MDLFSNEDVSAMTSMSMSKEEEEETFLSAKQVHESIHHGPRREEETTPTYDIVSYREVYWNEAGRDLERGKIQRQDDAGFKEFSVVHTKGAE